ncbi:putative steroid reductase DET2 [Planoprotostelium fungivorum]|uniref:Putative steroid reductase DET2 n=1 Tax=Planoprotostelium fungivorum TaxID=1890364 RepID=A0A2P6NSM2_9EUKA|nr:putative steroid reductase DET2 [Planoprotostelium fungivorum]
MIITQEPIAFHYLLTTLWIGLALIVTVVLQFITAGYGRHSQPGRFKVKGQCWVILNIIQMNNRLTWLLMEIPSPTLILYFMVTSEPDHRDVARLLFGGLWLIHYFQRCFIFPFRIPSNNQTMDLLICTCAFGFNLCNGYVVGRWMFIISPAQDYSFSTLQTLSFFIGIIMFVYGFASNIICDGMLVDLKKKISSGKKEGEQVDPSGRYAVPRGYLFDYVAAPNYFSEIVEWTGYYIMTQNYFTLSFLVWNLANLVPRARTHLKWYQTTFPKYPKERKAVFPFLY